MTVTGKLYSQVFGIAFNKEIDLLDDTIKTMLTTSSYTPDQDAHDYKNDVTNEVTGTGYSAGGSQIANDTFAYNSGSNTWTYDGDDVSWTGSTITASVAVVYDSTPGADSSRPLICYQSSDSPVSTTSGTFTVQWNASGIFTIAVS